MLGNRVYRSEDPKNLLLDRLLLRNYTLNLNYIIFDQFYDVNFFIF